MITKKNSFLKSAFTLLELLVVIGIIAVLVAIGTVSYSTAQKKARDAKRQTDLRSAQNFMEQCYSINDYEYPTLTNTSGRITAICTPSGETLDIVDPKNTAPNKYTRTQGYSITATLEIGNPFTVLNQQ